MSASGDAMGSFLSNMLGAQQEPGPPYVHTMRPPAELYDDDGNFAGYEPGTEPGPSYTLTIGELASRASALVDQFTAVPPMSPSPGIGDVTWPCAGCGRALEVGRPGHSLTIDLVTHKVEWSCAGQEAASPSPPERQRRLPRPPAVATGSPSSRPFALPFPPRKSP